ncbi:MAG: threonine/serine exporter family protein [Clostridium fessum]
MEITVRESRGWRRQSWWRWRLRRASVWRSWQSGWREDRYDRDDKRIDDPERGGISGGFGFSLLVDMPRKYLVYAGITGGAGWLAYLVSMQVGTSQVAAAFFSSLAAALLSQVFARVLKAPVTIFLVAENPCRRCRAHRSTGASIF